MARVSSRRPSRPRRELTVESPFSWWYYLSAPAPVGAGASFDEHERVRRGRIASLIMLGLLTVVVIVAADRELLPHVVPSTFLLLGCCLAAIPLNRAGFVRT